MRTNYVLIDYENVQPSSLAGLDAEHFRVLVFVGASQSKLTFEIVAAVQKLGVRAEYVKIAGNGSNALDFHIAFHIGQLAAQDPTACFHIVSGDSGFDPLIKHLKERKVFASRSKDVSEIPILKPANTKTKPARKDVSEIPMLKPANTKTKPARIDLVLANLQQRGDSKPKTMKTLRNMIESLFMKQLSEEELVALLKELQAKGFIAVNKTRVTYAQPLPPA